MNNKITILVCCHKQDYYAQKYPFLPIQVGRAISSVDLGIQGDDTGDNISWKNRNYCELTALYWAWKNLKEVDIIGLCHYRRYFLLKITYLILVYKNMYVGSLILYAMKNVLFLI